MHHLALGQPRGVTLACARTPDQRISYCTESVRFDLLSVHVLSSHVASASERLSFRAVPTILVRRRQRCRRLRHQRLSAFRRLTTQLAAKYEAHKHGNPTSIPTESPSVSGMPSSQPSANPTSTGSLTPRPSKCPSEIQDTFLCRQCRPRPMGPLEQAN